MLSSALFFPYSQRFVKNALKLRQLGIPTVTPRDLYSLPHIARTAVHYEPVRGVTLRNLAKNGLTKDHFIENLAAFIAKLHQQGIYFRSIHLGNIVLSESGELGLIDIADLKFFTKPLSKRQRKRNFEHLIRPKEDKPALTAYLNELQTAYGNQLTDSKN
ncbi:MAG: hypothetical protein V7721_08890 [Porticoccaceae bacterium]